MFNLAKLSAAGQDLAALAALGDSDPKALGDKLKSLGYSTAMARTACAGELMALHESCSGWLAQTAAYKEKGNAAFKAGLNMDAAEAYRGGIASATAGVASFHEARGAAEPLLLSLHNNLAATCLKLEQWPETIESANAALAIDRSNAKALYRRGVACARSGAYAEARQDLLAVCKADGSNREARAELTAMSAKLAGTPKKVDYGRAFGKASGGLYAAEEAAAAKAKVAAATAAAEEEEAIVAEWREECGRLRAEATRAREAEWRQREAARLARLKKFGGDDEHAQQVAELVAAFGDGGISGGGGGGSAAGSGGAEEEDKRTVGQRQLAAAQQNLKASSSEGGDAGVSLATLAADGGAEEHAPISLAEFKKRRAERKAKAAAAEEAAERRRAEAAQASRRTARAEASVVVDDEEELKDAKGYRKRADGSTTTYFDREVPSADGAKQTPAPPKKIDSVAATVRPSGPHGAAWNSAGTFEEKDVSTWAHGRIKETLCGLESEERDLVLEVTAVSSIEGSASIFASRGKAKSLFDLRFDVEWKATVRVDCSTLCEGLLRFTDVSNAADKGGVDFEAACELKTAVPSQEHQRRVVAAVEGGLREEVGRALRRFAEELAGKAL